MSRGVTEDDVWQAADALLREGARPTIERVRQKIGRGSPNTVSPYLDAWFRQLGSRLHGPQGGGLSSAAPDPVQQAAQHFWELALQSARMQLEESFSGLRTALELEREQLAQERAGMRAEAERMAARQQGLEAALAAQRAQLEDASRQRQQLEEQLAARQAETSALRAEASGARELAQQLAAQLDSQRQMHEAERSRADERAAANERRWALELDRTRDALKQSQARLGAAEAEAARRIRELDSERERLAAELREASSASIRLRHEVETCGLQLEQVRQALAEVREAASRQARESTAQQERLQFQLEETTARLKARDEAHAVLLRSLAPAGTRRRSRRREEAPDE